MTQDEIIALAVQAGFDEHQAKFDTRIEAFANLVAQEVRDRIMFGSRDDWVLIEREANIKIIKETPFSNWFQFDLVEAIRARGEQA